jgi:hypothetical protein
MVQALGLLAGSGLDDESDYGYLVAIADAAGGWAVHSQAHAKPLRRGAVRPMVENPYFQYFCGELVFRHELPFDRSSLTRWRQRLALRSASAELPTHSAWLQAATPLGQSLLGRCATKWITTQCE